ncbi:MAG: cyclase family protein [Thermoplasmata archaeon]
MRVIDISMPVYPGMPCFPGDPAVTVQRTHSIDRGDAYNVSTVNLGTHTGTHVDPPIHFLNDGVGIDAVDLGRLNGPCWVHAVPSSARLIDAAALRDVPAGTSRLLLKTRNSARWVSEDRFFPDYVALSPDGAREALHRGVRLVGIDALSIESDTSGTFPVHHALLGEGALILEGLRLAEVAPGPYQLACLPLRLRGGDGGPARAMLSTE